ncbi:MAG TPA: hypothetical protein VGS62_07150 [Streptosporangiaceae bacterium]|nr:hypothetical protein [Streptosporangiaceae bacterium]
MSGRAARIRAQEDTMGLRFVGRDPETDGDHCPAVFIDEGTAQRIFDASSVRFTGWLPVAYLTNYGQEARPELRTWTAWHRWISPAA